MNDGLEGADFTDDIFWGNEDDNEVVGNGREIIHSLRLGAIGGIMQMMLSSSMQPEVRSNGGNNAQPRVGSNERNNAQLEVGNNGQPEVKNNA
jgi:hypothetical protein